MSMPNEGACFHSPVSCLVDSTGCMPHRTPLPMRLSDLQNSEHRQVSTRPSFFPQDFSHAPASCNWFAVYTASRHEKRVAQHFSHRQIEHFLPLYQSQRKWKDGSRVTLHLPLFPGYIFVHIPKTDRVRVLNVPGALAVVGGAGREPASLPNDAIDALRCGLQRCQAEPHALLTVGSRARIRGGAFAGMEGVVLRRKNGFRVVLTLEQIMRSIAVEVSEADLEPLASFASIAA